MRPLAWDGERPDELLVGHGEWLNEVLIEGRGYGMTTGRRQGPRVGRGTVGRPS